MNNWTMVSSILWYWLYCNTGWQIPQYSRTDPFDTVLLEIMMADSLTGEPLFCLRLTFQHTTQEPLRPELAQYSTAYRNNSTFLSAVVKPHHLPEQIAARFPIRR